MRKQQILASSGGAEGVIGESGAVGGGGRVLQIEASDGTDDDLVSSTILSHLRSLVHSMTQS